MKSQDKKLAPSTLGHRCPPGLLKEWRCKAPPCMGLRSPGRKVNAESLCIPRDQPEKEREGGGERERESRHGRGHGSLCKNPITLFSKGAYIP